MSKYGDTPKAHDTDLCETCIHGLFVAGQSQKQSFKRCAVMQKPWPQYRITACTEYVEKTRMTRAEMERIATVIETNKKGEFIGFKKPEKKNSWFPWED